MPCYHPLYAIKPIMYEGQLKVKPRFVDKEFYDSFPNPDQKLLIPCGQCIGCRLEYSRQWAIRCVLEAQQWDINLFLTLTYDDDHLPDSLPEKIDPDTGEVYSFFDSNPLCKKDVVSFEKRLRRHLEYHYNHTNTRVFYCGEYGEKNGRPHYHMILFNLPQIPLSLWSKNKHGKPLFTSSVIDSCWKKGIAVLAEVNFDTCAYVARYMLKKQKGQAASFYDAHGLVPEFSGMSRRPGIGRDYYDKFRDKIYLTDEIILSGRKGKVQSLKPPRYYDRLYDIDDPESLAVIKEKRRETALSAVEIRSKSTSLSNEEYLKLLEDNKIHSISRLHRIIEY